LTSFEKTYYKKYFEIVSIFKRTFML